MYLSHVAKGIGLSERQEEEEDCVAGEEIQPHLQVTALAQDWVQQQVGSRVLLLLS